MEANQEMFIYIITLVVIACTMFWTKNDDNNKMSLI